MEKTPGNRMINNLAKKEIEKIWDTYSSSNKIIKNNKGEPINDIDNQRKEALHKISAMIKDYVKGEIDISTFKRTLDSFNKRNNLWGFTATKGQMFFNQLLKYSESNHDKVSDILKDAILEPTDLENALEKISKLENYTKNLFEKAKDKRKAPNPASVNYFLSYFWQVHNFQKWPIAYSSLINSFKELNLWNNQESEMENYRYFYNLNNEIKKNLKAHSNKDLNNWDIEHAFWNNQESSLAVDTKETKKSDTISLIPINEASFNLNDYLIPKISNLIQLGNCSEKSSSAKGADFERIVGEIFKLLDFDVELLGQGTGRNPDAIIKYREDNTVFLIDAKAYSSGYTLGTDDRAIREYINFYIPKLQKDGFKKIGFIIICNSFKDDLVDFINDITWNSDIKRMLLIESEALLYLLAYKTKDKLTLAEIIECLISTSGTIRSKDVIAYFDDK